MSRYVVFFHPGDTVPDRMKYIDDATAAPDANDDAATLGVTVGSLWIDTTNHKVYLAESVGTGTAEWLDLTGSGVTDHGALTGLADDDHPQYAQGTLHVDLSVSGSHDIDRDDGETHDLTLTGTATFTLSNPLASKATDLRIILRQDGTGSRTVTWPGSVEWVGGSAPTLQTAADAVDVIGLVTVDDGTTWYGFHGASGGGGTAATTVEAETTFGIASAVGTDTEYARQDHTHGTPANPVTAAAVEAVGRWEVLLIEDGSEPLTTEDGLDWLFVWVTD